MESSVVRREAGSFRPGCWLLLVALGLSSPGLAQDTYLDCLEDFERYAETLWHEAVGPGRPGDSGYWGDGNSAGNGGIRGSCGVAVAYATLVCGQPGAARNSARLDRIRQALHYAALTHLSGTNTCVDGKQWGHGWQTALWAGSMGLACLLVQDQLPAGTVTAVQRALADEATYRAGIPPASGYVSDTKAEENGWNSNVLALGAAWLAAHSNAPAWLDAAKRYLVNTYTVADTAGDPLADWVSTVTLYPSFALENHGFYHPTYQMVAGMSLGDSLLMARLANPAVAAALQPFAEHNVRAVWSNALSALVLDSGDFAYPAGLDWELHDFEQNSFITWMATHFDDPLARWAEARLTPCVRYRQIVNGDGQFVGPSGGGFYREAVEARRTAIAWLHQRYADFPAGPVEPPAEVVLHLPDVRVLHHRSAWGSVSVSYNDSRVMAVVEPAAADVPTNAFVATPRRPGILGLGALGNPTAAQLVRLALATNGFEAELLLTHGTRGTTHAYVKSTGPSFAVVEVPRLAEGAAAVEGGSFVCGIENDPLTGGTRRLDWAGGFSLFTNRSGLGRAITNGWVCVSDRYGLRAGPAGWFHYQAASNYNISGAAQDSLQFFPADPLGPRYAVWFPARTAAETAVLAGQVAWTVSGTNATLTFPGRDGTPEQLRVVVAPPSLPPPYPPYPVAVARITASSSQSTYPPSYAVDGNEGTFWVSRYGPTNHAEWLWADFTGTVALAEVRVSPRTDNGGYGPSAVRLVVNVTGAIPASGLPDTGTTVFEGTMSPTDALQARLARPVHATNAVLVMTGAYDRGNTNAPRNVQVVELLFRERARPGSYGDWALGWFTDAQLADAAVGAAEADPDADGAPNLLEFACGGDPWQADSAGAALRVVAVGDSACRLRWRERKLLGDVQRGFEASSDLRGWSAAEPQAVSVVGDEGDARVWEATFAAGDTARFFRLRYGR